MPIKRCSVKMIVNILSFLFVNDPKNWTPQSVTFEIGFLVSDMDFQIISQFRGFYFKCKESGVCDNPVFAVFVFFTSKVVKLGKIW